MLKSSCKNGQSEPPALTATQLTVNYDKIPVLWDINFAIPEGKMVGIIGPNGAGKSTLLKAALGIVEPLSGTVEFFGKPLKKVRKRVAYVPQRTSVDWDFPVAVLDVVLMGCYGKIGLLRWPTAKDRAAALAALELVGMEQLAHRQISQLSSGQQQRVFIARALVQAADIYLLDEPFAGVDLATEKAIVALLNTLKAEGKTLFVVHHDLNSIERYFDWLIMLNTCLIASGPVVEVFHPGNMLRTFGRSSALLDEAAKLSQGKQAGLR